MATPVKNEKDRLIGMWVHPEGGWEICYYQDGGKHSEYRRSETLARQRAAQLKHILEGTPLEPDEHPVIYWEKKLREAADHILANPDNETALDLGKVLAQMATAGLRAAAFYPAPNVQSSPDGPPVTQEDLTKLKTEDIVKLLDGSRKG